MAADPKDPKTTPETKKVETGCCSPPKSFAASVWRPNPKPPPVTLPGVVAAQC